MKTDIDTVIHTANKLFRLHVEQGTAIKGAAQIGHDYIEGSRLKNNAGDVAEVWRMAKIGGE